MNLELLAPSVGFRKIGDYWFSAADGNTHGLDLFSRHYSKYHYADGRMPKLFVGPGEKMVLLTDGALFVWRKFLDKSGQTGVNCAIFRNESAELSSKLILDAERIAWARWPMHRLYTYVNPRKVKSCNPGACFIFAGWRKCGVTKKRGFLIFEKLPAHS